MFNALIYALAPAELAVVQSIPNKFPGVMLAPVFLVIAGSSPSNPPCNPTVNFKKFDISTPANVDPDILAPAVIDELASTADALGCIKESSRLKSLFAKAVAPFGNGLSNWLASFVVAKSCP